MNPQQQMPPAPTPSEQDPYAFIMNNGIPQQKPNLLNIASGSPKKRIAIIGIGLVSILIIFFMFASLMFGGGQGQTDKLLALAQQQTELIRISDLANKEGAAHAASTQVLASNTSLSLQSSQQQILGLMSKGDRAKSQKQLGAKQSTKTDAALKSAAQNNRYDEAFTEIMASELSKYQSELKVSYNSSKNTKEKQVLDSAYKGATLLLSQTK